MNTTVNFEIAELLKERGYDEPCYNAYNHRGMQFANGWLEYLWENGNERPFTKEDLKPQDTLAPTIADVVSWLYEKHGIWVTVSMENNEEDAVSFYYTILHNDEGEAKFKERMSDYNSPTEAYSEGITYTLENLIQGEV